MTVLSPNKAQILVSSATLQTMELGLLGEMGKSRARAETIPEEPGAPCSSRKQRCAKNKTKHHNDKHVKRTQASTARAQIAKA